MPENLQAVKYEKKRRQVINVYRKAVLVEIYSRKSDGCGVGKILCVPIPVSPARGLKNKKDNEGEILPPQGNQACYVRQCVTDLIMHRPCNVCKTPRGLHAKWDT